jgi:hypothetical protein
VLFLSSFGAVFLFRRRRELNGCRTRIDEKAVGA